MSAPGFDIFGQIVGTGTNFFGQGLSAWGDKKQAEDTANIADYNASIAEQNADAIRVQGAEMMRRSLVNSRKIIGAAEAAYGASGISGTSAQAVLKSSAAQAELNALTLKNNSDIKATAYENEAALDHFRSHNITAAGDIGFLGHLIGAISGATARVPSGGDGGGSGGGSSSSGYNQETASSGGYMLDAMGAG